MGIICCKKEEKINPYSKKLMQINLSSSNGNINDSLKNIEKAELINPNSNNLINVYDIEDQAGIQIETNLRSFRETDGLSQLNFNNNLYFCGADKDDTTTGSYLLKFDPIKSGSSNINFLINSFNHHYYPTLMGYKNDFILVIGGLLSQSSEMYNLKINKWKKLPELPEERYKSCTIHDDNTDYVYLFGGFNTETGKNCTTILRLNMKNPLIWETLIVRINAALLARNSCAILKLANTIYILGGVDNDNNATDSIISYDFHSRIANLERKRLETKSVFEQHLGVDLNKSEFFLIDENSNVHKIYKNDFQIGYEEFKQAFDLIDP